MAVRGRGPASIVRRPQLDTAVEAAGGQQGLMRMGGHTVNYVPVSPHGCQQPPCTLQTLIHRRKPKANAQATGITSNSAPETVQVVSPQ